MSCCSKILSVAYDLPEKVMTNKDFEKMVETNDEWITKRTGIKKRHFTGKNETSSTMGTSAARKALEKAGMVPDDLDMIIVNTVTGDYRYPSTSTLVQKHLGMSKHVPCFDLQAACTGFVYGISVADAFIKTGYYKNILVIGVENLSKFTDMQDRNTCVLFGDGAGAVVMSKSKTPGIMSHDINAAGDFGSLILFPAGGSAEPTSEETVRKRLHYTQMEGRETYKHAVSKMTETAKTSLERAGLSVEDVTWLIPHQANIRIIQTVTKRLKINKDRVFVNVDKVGNTSAASTAIALAQMEEENLLKKGDIIVLSAFGSGLTWGSLVLNW